MTPNEFSPHYPLAGQRIAQAIAASLEMDLALLANAAQLFECGARDGAEAQRLCRQVGDTLRTIVSLVPR